MTYHNYIFVTPRESFLSLPKAKQETYKKHFLETLGQEKNVMMNTYATLGFKVKTNILLWFQSESVEDIQRFLNTLMHTDLGQHLEISYTLFGMTRPTQYTGKSSQFLKTERKGEKYLIIYPFSKTKEWYFLDLETRRKLMGGHITIGRKYPQIEQILLYSYGVDDNEFIVSYETDDLPLFQSLVMELRSDTVRTYTLNDTPIFTCVFKSPEDALTFL